MPPVPNIGGTQAVWAGSHQFVLPRQLKPDENKAIASRVFVNWISQQSLTWADAGMVPARNSVRKTGVQDQGRGERVRQGAGLHPLRATDPRRERRDARVGGRRQHAMLGKKEIATALSEAAGRADKILAANQKKYQ